jgi:hypothetical protein
MSFWNVGCGRLTNARNETAPRLCLTLMRADTGFRRIYSHRRSGYDSSIQEGMNRDRAAGRQPLTRGDDTAQTPGP